MSSKLKKVTGYLSFGVKIENFSHIFSMFLKFPSLENVIVATLIILEHGQVKRLFPQLLFLNRDK